jgi:hypothetical protein
LLLLRLLLLLLRRRRRLALLLLLCARLQLQVHLVVLLYQLVHLLQQHLLTRTLWRSSRASSSIGRGRSTGR